VSVSAPEEPLLTVSDTFDDKGEIASGHASSSGLAFVVLGMHRSGTSAMTRVLALSGAALPQNMLPPQADNPMGFWEPKDLVELNERFLTDGGSAWDDIFGYRSSAVLSAVSEHSKSYALEALCNNYKSAPDIALKDPRICLLVPLWDELLRRAGYNPVYIIMVRHPLDVAESLHIRDNFSHNKSMMLWTSYMLAAERDTRHLRRVFVNYNKFLGAPLSTIERIERHANVVVRGRTTLSDSNIEQFINPELTHHYSAPNALALRSDIWPVVGQVYDWFASASVSDNPLAPSPTLDSSLHRMNEVFAAVGGVVAELRTQLGDLNVLVNALVQSRNAITHQAAQAEEAWKIERLTLSSQLALTQDIQKALDAGEAERHRLVNKLERLNAEFVTRAAERRDNLKLRDAALEISQSALEASRQA
jgi:hypothetical protein